MKRTIAETSQIPSSSTPRSMHDFPRFFPFMEDLARQTGSCETSMIRVCGGDPPPMGSNVILICFLVSPTPTRCGL